MNDIILLFAPAITTADSFPTFTTHNTHTPANVAALHYTDLRTTFLQ